MTNFYKIIKVGSSPNYILYPPTINSSELGFRWNENFAKKWKILRFFFSYFAKFYAKFCIFLRNWILLKEAKINFGNCFYKRDAKNAIFFGKTNYPCRWKPYSEPITFLAFFFGRNDAKKFKSLLSLSVLSINHN